MSLNYQQVAQITLEQMGGSRALSLMTGATNFTSSGDGRGALAFRFKCRGKANYCKITLTPMDTYTMEFGKVGRMAYKVVETVEDVYNDNLRQVFTRVTGMTLSVPIVKGING